MTTIVLVGVRFRGCATHSSEELKSRNFFDRKVMPLISLRKDMSKQHELTKDWGGGWHRCGTFQMNSDGEVSNDAITIMY